MNLQKILVPVMGVVMVVVGYRSWGWQGVALVAALIVMWGLLHFTRLTNVLQRAGNRPIGYCDSAVMVNAKLRPKVNLLHVIALTRAIGEQLSPPDTDPEIYRWTDGTGSHVTCEFVRGRLVKWTLVRPKPEEAEGAAGASPEAPPAAP